MREKTSLKPCSKCKSWRDCAGKSWYSPADIRYCRNQVIWLITHFIEYNAGKFHCSRTEWLPEGGETGYTDSPQTQHSVSSHAPFERTLQIVCDVLRRISKTGKDGRLLVLEVQNEVQILSEDARNALNYINGWREKKQGYHQWLANRKYRHKTIKLSKSCGGIDKHH